MNLGPPRMPPKEPAPLEMANNANTQHIRSTCAAPYHMRTHIYTKHIKAYARSLLSAIANCEPIK